MTSETRHRRFMAEINVIPLVDVVLVLLVIFMVTAPLITTGNIDLPSVSNSAAPPDAGDVLTLSINAQRQYQLDSKRQGVLADEGSSLPDVVAQVQNLQSAKPGLPVVIAASRKLSYDTVLQTMDALRKAQHLLFGEVRLHASNEVLEFGRGDAEVGACSVCSTLALGKVFLRLSDVGVDDCLVVCLAVLPKHMLGFMAEHEPEVVYAVEPQRHANDRLLLVKPEAGAVHL